MKQKPRDPGWLLQDPHTRKWMVQCVACKRWGYRDDAPPQFFGQAYLERYFEKMKLDERGVCDQCRGAGSTSIMPARISDMMTKLVPISRGSHQMDLSNGSNSAWDIFAQPMMPGGNMIAQMPIEKNEKQNNACSIVSGRKKAPIAVTAPTTRRVMSIARIG